MNEKELLKIKERIDDAKSEINKLEGKQASLLDQLKEQFNCSSIKEAEKQLDKQSKQIEELEQQIEEGVAELKNKYNFDDE